MNNSMSLNPEFFAEKFELNDDFHAWICNIFKLLNCCKDNQKKISLLVSFCLASPARTQFGTAAGTVDLFSLQKPWTVRTPFLTCSVSVCSKIRSVLYAYAVALCHRCTKIQFYLLVWFFFSWFWCWFFFSWFWSWF